MSVQSSWNLTISLLALVWLPTNAAAQASLRSAAIPAFIDADCETRNENSIRISKISNKLTAEDVSGNHHKIMSYNYGRFSFHRVSIDGVPQFQVTTNGFREPVYLQASEVNGRINFYQTWQSGDITYVKLVRLTDGRDLILLPQGGGFEGGGGSYDDGGDPLVRVWYCNVK